MVDGVGVYAGVYVCVCVCDFDITCKFIVLLSFMQ